MEMQVVKYVSYRLDCSWNTLGARSKHANLMTFSSIFEVLRASGGGTIGPRRPFGRSLEPLELLETSWSALGGLLERCWRLPGPKKQSWKRLLAAL